MASSIVQASELVISPDPAGATLTYAGAAIRTPGGAEVRGDTRLLEHIRNELEARGELTLAENGVITAPNFVGGYGFYFIEREYVSVGLDDLTKDLEDCLLQEPMFYPPADLATLRLARSSWEPVLDMLATWGVALTDLREHAEALQAEEEMEADEKLSVLRQCLNPELVEAVRERYQRLPAAERAVVTFLQAIHFSVLFPLALVTEACSPLDYAKGILSAKLTDAELLLPRTKGAAPQPLVELRNQARAGQAYVEHSHPPRSVTSTIARGVAAQRDFVPHLRWDPVTQEPHASVTERCVRLIVAFANADGGVVYAGAQPDGQITGLTEDAWQPGESIVHFVAAAIRAHADGDLDKRVMTQLETVAGQTVAVITCGRSPRRVLLDQLTGETVMLRRRGRRVISERADATSEPYPNLT